VTRDEIEKLRKVKRGTLSWKIEKSWKFSEKYSHVLRKVIRKEIN